LKKIIVLVFFTFSLSILFGNELNFNTKSFSYPLLNKQSPFSIDSYSQDTNNKSSNIYKSNKMKKFGNAGIPFAVVGGVSTVGGLVMVGFFYSQYIISGEFLHKTKSYTISLNELLYMFGIFISSVGEILLIVGIVFMAVGYSVSKHYLNKKQKNMSFKPYIDTDKNGFKCGVAISFL